jgi:short-subunit dehydrogenase
MNTLANKRILLTGATGGIGQALLEALVAEGAQVMITGRNDHRLRQLTTIHGGAIQAFRADLDDADEREALLSACEAMGGVDILVNNAGISEFGDAESQSLERLMKTNLLTPALMCQAFLPMLRSRNGILLNVGSTFGSIGYPGFTGYCASKFGLRGYTEALAREESDSGLQVLYAAPRATRTAINSAAVDQLNASLGQGVDSPEQVAAGIVEQLRRGSKRLYIGFPERLFVILNALVPSLVDRALSGKLARIKQYFTARQAEA